MRRVSVVGCSGSGKSTVAAQLAAALGVPYLELDAIRHQAGWRELPDDEFVERAEVFVAADGWVVDGNYSQVRDAVVWSRADTIVWLDLPRRTVMRQIIWRSLRRAATREVLWNGNRESWRGLVAWDPYKSIIRWSWTSYARVNAHYLACVTAPEWASARFVRLRSRRETRAFIVSVAFASGTAT